MSDSTAAEGLMALITETWSQVQKQLDELDTRYSNNILRQKDIILDQHKLMLRQNKALDDLQSKIMVLEENVVLPSHVTSVNERRHDNHDQNNRKLNLKMDGIPIFVNDSPQQILDYIKREVKKLNIDVTDDRYESACRIGTKVFKDNKQHQSVLLKMSCPLARQKIYMNRNIFPFQLQVDLTPAREETLKFAKGQVSSGVNPAARRQVEFVYADLDGTLNLKTKSGQFYGFSSDKEFLSLVTWLDKQNNARQISLSK